MKKIILFFALAAIISCGNNESKKSSSSTISEENTEVENPKSTMEKSPVYQKLQGIWVNRNDTNSILTFEGAQVTNAYQDTLSIRTVGFVLGNSCLNTPAVAENDKQDLFITTTGMASECYFIKELNDSILTMEFINGKIDLNFTKKK